MRKRENAIEVLRRDHRELQQMFHAFQGAERKDQERLCRDMIDALRTHTRIEEEVFYPYLREATGQELLLEEANVEHGTAKGLIEELASGSDVAHRQAVVKVLSEYVGHHIREEEERIFPLAQKTGVDLEALGAELLEHKEGRRGGPAGGPRRAGKGSGQAEAKRGNGRHGGSATRARGDDEQFLAEHGDELSPSARRAKWIHAPGEREDHPGQTLATRNWEVIRAWAEERGGKPATSPGGDPRNPRVLRFDFPDYDKGLTEVSWQAWRKVFEDRALVFIFQQHMKAGNQSNFFRLDSPERDDG